MSTIIDIKARSNNSRPGHITITGACKMGTVDMILRNCNQADSEVEPG
jgi:hypothetical protein